MVKTTQTLRQDRRDAVISRRDTRACQSPLEVKKKQGKHLPESQREQVPREIFVSNLQPP